MTLWGEFGGCCTLGIQSTKAVVEAVPCKPKQGGSLPLFFTIITLNPPYNKIDVNKLKSTDDSKTWYTN